MSCIPVGYVQISEEYGKYYINNNGDIYGSTTNKKISHNDKLKDFVQIEKPYDIYYINRNGEIYNSLIDKFMCSQKKNYGYYVNLLDYDKNKKLVGIHNLVAKYFLNNTDDKKVWHIDKNLANNNVKNLKCVSQKEYNELLNDDVAKKRVKYDELKDFVQMEKPFDNYYINNIGKIFNIRKNRLSSQFINNSSKCYYVELNDGNKVYSLPVHKLVAKYFLNYDCENNNIIVIHKDNNKLNNNVNNLECISKKIKIETIKVRKQYKKCVEENCENKAMYGDNKEDGRIYCVLHRKKYMKERMNKKCLVLECERKASYNNSGEKQCLYCLTHKKPDMVYMRRKTCIFPNCEKTPSFNFPTEIKSLYCSEHKLDGMICVSLKKCSEVGCEKIPHFNYEGIKKGLYCAEHKKEDMVNIKSKHCLECNSRASYNYKTEKSGLYCAEHKKTNMYDISNVYCMFDNCYIRASYNYADKMKPLYCKIHKLENMCDVKNKKCVENGCITIPIYNYIGEKRGLYCKKHKKENMINVKDKKCAKDGCIKIPLYNYNDKKTGLYCFEHKLNNMIDVSHKKCINDDCSKRPNYNYSNETTPLYCAEHKLTNMVDISSKKCCHNECKEDAIFGYVNKRKQFCVKHKLSDMINLDIENKCSNQNCSKEYEFVISNIKYCLEHYPNDSYETIIKKKCRICDIEEKSNYICNDCKKISNKKEWSIIRFIKKNIDEKFYHNSSVPVNECSKKRPDVFFEKDKHVVIVEIDENQHKSYEEICECSRINEIVNSIGGKSVVFIRYNPDKCYNNKKEIVFDLESKLKILIDSINNELNKNYDTFCVKIIQLFFDDNEKEYQKIKTMDITNIVCV